MNKSNISIAVIFVTFFVLTSCVSGYEVGRSNESIQAAVLIDKAIACMGEMQIRNISLNRINETINEALQFYSGQVALENRGKVGDYKLIKQYANNSCLIRDSALKAQDELSVFNETYNSAKSQINLSQMSKEYNAVIQSFDEERFEDTVSLIDVAYKKLSEVQSSQTALKLFYDTTTRSIKDFFKENWKTLSIGFIVIVILLVVFWKAFRRYLLSRKLNHLYIQKKSVEGLIKKIQFNYFETKKMSESEFSVKLSAFKEMIRNIDGQIPEVRESLARLDSQKVYGAGTAVKERNKTNIARKRSVKKRVRGKVFKRRRRS